MKKILPRLFILSFAMTFFLVGCSKEHHHTFDSEWNKTIAHHWKNCKDENCIQISDLSEHSWDQGTVTISPTASVEGEKTFTCNVCGTTKKEPIEFNGISKDELQEIYASDNLKNVTIGIYSSIPTKSGAHITMSDLCKLDNEKYSINGTVSGSSLDVSTLKNTYRKTIHAFIKHWDLFKYDEMNNVYTCNHYITYMLDPKDESSILTIHNVVIAIDEELNILSIAWDECGDDGDIKYQLTFTDRGTTVVE